MYIDIIRYRLKTLPMIVGTVISSSLDGCYYITIRMMMMPVFYDRYKGGNILFIIVTILKTSIHAGIAAFYIGLRNLKGNN